MLFPTTCPVCHEMGVAPCRRCRSMLPRAGRHLSPPGLTSCTALFSYEGAARQLVTSFKYRNQLAHLAWLGRAMATVVEPGAADLVTWVPTTAPRARQRGFDQARALAACVARELALPARGTLRRIDRVPQTGRSLLERLDPPRFRPRRLLRGRVLLVDDVLTTGTTLSAAAAVLHGAGAEEVHGLVVAETPLKLATIATE